MKHIGYCTNAFPSTDTDSFIRDSVPRMAQTGIRLDLWLPRVILDSLDTRADDIMAALNQYKLKVLSLNVFPLCDFQAEVVKTEVYCPNWWQNERFDLSLNAARFVASHLQPDSPFTLSTLAGRYHPDRPAQAKDFDELASILKRFAQELKALHQATGCSLQLALEPEPFTTLQKTEDVLQLFERLDSTTRECITLNLDCCHFSVMGESPLQAFKAFDTAGINVSKIHASTALKIEAPFTPEKIDFLKSMDEPRFLHQSTLLTDDGASHLNDLNRVFDKLDICNTLLCHFHMPLFVDSPRDLFSTTHDDTVELLQHIKGRGIPTFVETYTWDVLGHVFAESPEEGLRKEVEFLNSIMQT